jgi:hypothetical protein
MILAVKSYSGRVIWKGEAPYSEFVSRTLPGRRPTSPVASSLFWPPVLTFKTPWCQLL